MLHPTLPLNALRAFEAAARHQNFTRAALELCVSQAALSHQIRGLEDRLGIRLFHRLPRGVALTEEGAALYPVLNESFERISASIARYTGGPAREVLTLGVVGTFATGWLLPRLAAFEAAHPDIELRLQTHNNRIDLAGEGLDLAIPFRRRRLAGPGLHGDPRCAVRTAVRAGIGATAETATRLGHAAAAALLPQRRMAALAAGGRSGGVEARGPVFDSSLTVAMAAVGGAGVALLPLRMFEQELAEGRLLQPFSTTLELGRYWLTRLRSRAEREPAKRFREWLQAQG